MHTIFRLPWCSESVGDPVADKLAAQKLRASPIMEMPVFSKLKRKRTGSPEASFVHENRDAKKRRILEPKPALAFSAVGCGSNGQTETAAVTTADSEQSLHLVAQSAPPSTAALSCQTKSNSTHTLQPQHRAFTPTAMAPKSSQVIDKAAAPTLQETVDHQLSVEILFKHRELRLIEQELAKCQAALEQLRRCETISFPGVSGLSESLSTGTGPALRPTPGFSQPPAPAPWGVADGPYTRHYARWLLPDPAFDSMHMSAFYTDFISAAHPDGRATRNSGAGIGRAGISRGSRDSSGSNAQLSTPDHVIPTPRNNNNKSGPLVIKRLADQQFVKLVCSNCPTPRSNFNSVQGFLNHCRIAHKIDYKSHEAAAIDCGRLLEAHESDLAANAAPPVGTTAKTPAPKPQAVAQVHSRVHSLIHSPPTWRPTWKRQRLAASRDVSHQSQATASTVVSDNTPSSSSASFRSTSFVPSLSTPYLSAQFAKRGLGGDLEALTTQARERVDVTEEDEEDDAQEVAANESSSGRLEDVEGAPSRTVSGAAHLIPERPQSRKGHRQPIQRPRPAPLSSCLQSQPFRSEIPESPQDANLSPQTADSNPGLVSDHDDDPTSDADDADDSRSEIGPTDLNMTPACGDAMEVDLDVEDDDDEHAVLIRPRSMLAHGHDEIHSEHKGSPSRPRSRYGEGAK